MRSQYIQGNQEIKLCRDYKLFNLILIMNELNSYKLKKILTTLHLKLLRFEEAPKLYFMY